MSDTPTNGLPRALALAALLTFSPAVLPQPSVAATSVEIFNQEALSHAHAIVAAWHRLEQHVLHESSSATNWTGLQPPAAAGWRDDRTLRGLGARYCDGVLLVYAATGRLKGVGNDQRSVRLAPHLFSTDYPRPAPLHWLTGSKASGGLGRADVDLPSCMTGLPSGRVALAGRVADPFGVTMATLTRQTETRACSVGTHGSGRTFTRNVVQDVNGRGVHVGEARPGAWRLLSDTCTDDATTWEHYRVVCTFDAGEPHNRVIAGEDIYRRKKTVTATGTTWGLPEFVSSSCWRHPEPEVPVADIRVTRRTETRSVPCASPHTGTQTHSRTVHIRSTQFPWDAEPILQVTGASSWNTTGDTCREDSSGGGNDGGDGREMGFDTDGDGVADYDSIHDVPPGLHEVATPAPIGGTTEGHGGRVGGPSGGPAGGNDGSSGGNGCGCGGPGGGGPGDVGGGGSSPGAGSPGGRGRSRPGRNGRTPR